MTDTLTMSAEQASRPAGQQASRPAHPRLLRPEHPIIPVPTQEEIDVLVRTPEGRAIYAEWYNDFQARIDKAEEDKGEPILYGFELPRPWHDADEQLRRAKRGLYASGGKRASKSEWAAKRFMQSALHFPKGMKWALQGDERTSIATQQKLIWKYLPREIKAMNSPRSRHGFAKINYSPDGGFASRVLVLPNRTEIHFLTYNQEPKQYQGWELGANISPEDMAAAPDHIFNIGAWADEDMPLDWFNTVDTRCSTRSAKWLWTFSTLEGITTTIKEVIGTPKTIVSLPALDLPQNRKHVPDCPPGHMPYIAQSSNAGIAVVFFHTCLNLFGKNYEEMRLRVIDKAPSIIMRDLYGWSEDTRQRAFPLFGSWNIIESDELPVTGTNYMLTDPAGARNWASMWVRAVPGNPTTYYIYRDWPDQARYGPWAVPSANDQPDGDPGPAQRSLGFGWVKYKQMWLREEGWTRTSSGADPSSTENREMEDGRIENGSVTEWARETSHEGGETIKERLIDPRAGRNQVKTVSGNTCAIDELARKHYDARNPSLLVAPSMTFWPASGVNIEEGIAAVNSLLDWNKDEPLCPIINEPHLYVTSNCQQVIWAMANYTGQGGEDGACKDFADLLRYFALADWRYIAQGAVKTRGQGSY